MQIYDENQKQTKSECFEINMINLDSILTQQKEISIQLTPFSSSKEIQDVYGLWEIEKQHILDSKAPISGQRFRIRHFITGLYLSFNETLFLIDNPNQIQCEFEISLKNFKEPKKGQIEIEDPIPYMEVISSNYS